VSMLAELPTGAGMTTAPANSPWPAEDGGPERQQRVPGRLLGDGDGDGDDRQRLQVHSRRAWLSTMTVLGAPGEVYLLTHSALRARIGLPTTAQVERIHPETLETLERSPRLPGGPMWPGGLALHASGDLHVVYGNHVHRLDRHCQPLASRQLPGQEPYNGFVTLPGGQLVTWTRARCGRWARRWSAPSRASPAWACGATASTWSGPTACCVTAGTPRRARLAPDAGWRWDYLAGTRNSFGWDLVLAGGHAWFMDNGDHSYLWTMRGAGRRRSANRLLRVSLADARLHAAWDVSGRAAGCVTNPPLVDLKRGIVLAYDSGNAFLRAWDLQEDGQLTPRWERPGLGCASHMLLYEDSGEVVTNDHQGLREDVVVLDIATGRERARAATGGRMQGVVFPSPGWGRDLYWCSMDRIARLHVTESADT